ncbi:MAG: hypothetical protein ACJ8AO_11315 [Gemmatimonadaceae bacterium]|jgi:hypothetical protein
MGSKASNFFQSDRPESGGANKDDIKDKSGLHELDRQKVAKNMQDAASDAAGDAQAEGKSGMQNGVESPRNTQ